jgi:hypothetical protein
MKRTIKMYSIVHFFPQREFISNPYIVCSLKVSDFKKLMFNSLPYIIAKVKHKITVSRGIMYNIDIT